MNCSEVQECLSAYFDGELADEARAAVAAHLADCSACAEELALFGNLSEMTAALADPRPSSPSWSELEAKLYAKEEKRISLARFMRLLRFPMGIWAVATTLLIAVGLSVFAYQTWFSPDDHGHLAGDFEHYLEEFDKNPEAAQHVLLAKYRGRPVTLQEASATLRYEPVISKGLPSGCSLEEVYLLDMPCCTCAQAVCRCGGGQHIAVFEHDDDEPSWFGDRPAIECLCDGKPTSVVQIDGRLAATWRHGKHYITIIGARDLEEVVRFVAYLNGSKSGG